VSILQAKVDPDSLELKVNEAMVAVVDPLGPEAIVVSGAVVSTGGGVEATVQLRVAGELSVFPAASVARTENWWSPVARLEYPFGELHGRHL